MAAEEAAAEEEAAESATDLTFLCIGISGTILSVEPWTGSLDVEPLRTPRCLRASIGTTSPLPSATLADDGQ